MKIVFVIKTLAHVKGGAERVLTTVANELAQRPEYDIQIMTFDQKEIGPVYPIDDKVKLVCLEAGNVSGKSGAKDIFGRISLLRDTIGRESPHLVIPFMSSSFVPVSLALALTGIPVLASEHGVFPGSNRSPAVLFLVTISVFFVEKITCVSEAAKNDISLDYQKKDVSVAQPCLSGYSGYN